MEDGFPMVSLVEKKRKEGEKKKNKGIPG